MRRREPAERGETMGNGQVWSMDLIIAVVVFLLAVGVFYFLTNHRANADQSKLQIESQLIANKVTGEEAVSIVNGGAVDEQKLSNLANIPYDELKSRLGLSDDFCIVLLDQNGAVILVGNGTEQRVGIGNGNLTLNLTTLGKSFNCSDVYS